MKMTVNTKQQQNHHRLRSNPNEAETEQQRNKKHKSNNNHVISDDSERLVFEEVPSSHHPGGPTGPTYCRCTSTARRQLESDLLKLYEREDDDAFSALVLPSGMAAISAVLQSLVNTKISSSTSSEAAPFLIVHGNEIYFEVHNTLQYIQKGSRGCVNALSIDVTNSRAVLELFATRGDEISVFYWESASNPSSLMLDPTLLAKLKRMAPHCVFVCDNTWLSAVSFNPLDYGADIVVESMTKHLSGGACIGGMVVGSKKKASAATTADGDDDGTEGLIMDAVAEYVRVFGIFVDADRCRLFSQRLLGAHQRAKASAKAAHQLAAWLCKDDRVTWVDYPLLPSHPSYAIASRCLTVGPSCIWVQFPCSAEDFLAVVHAADSPLEFKSSFGGPFSRVDHWSTSTTTSSSSSSSSSSNNEDDDSATTPCFVQARLSTGFQEDAEATIVKVKTLLDRLF